MKIILKVIFLFFVQLTYLIAQPSTDQSILYLFPKPDSRDMRPQTSIIVKVAPELNGQITLHDIAYSIKGDKSGSHVCTVSHIRNTITFKPHSPFAANEHVDVNIQWGQNITDSLVRFSFKTGSAFDYISNQKKPAESLINLGKQENENSLVAANDPIVINGVAVPHDFPILKPFVFEPGIAPGRLFLSIMQDANPYIMILENDGTPYFYRKVERRTRDFKVQPTGHLSRMITPTNALSDGWEVLDSTFSRIAVYKAKDGYSTNDHEFVLTHANTYLIIADDHRRIDNRNLHGNHVQEVDIESGQVVFFWNSWDHLSYKDAIHGNDANGDYIHMNSIAVDYDSNLVISCRHLDQCIKIDRVTGDMIWRLGGVQNEFDFINDEHQISYQHHIQPVPGKPNYYTIFDNGNFHSPSFSRAVEFKLDPESMTAEKVWEYRATPDRYSGWMGSVQRLPNGNTLIGWADARQPKPTEVTPAGEVVYDADFTPPSHVYRAFRFEWEGMLQQPYLMTEMAANAVRLIFNKFGDEDVTKYNIYGGASENHTALIASTSLTWHEIDLWALPNRANYYFKVTAVNSRGEESAASNIESIYVNYKKRENSPGILGSTSQDDDNDPGWYRDNWHFGNSLTFDGIDDFVDCGNDPSLQISGSDITLEARVKARAWKEEVWAGCVIAKDENTGENADEGYMIRIGESGTVNFNLGGEGQTSGWHALNTPPNTLKLNIWHHIAATYDGSVMNIYVDGIRAATRAANVSIGDADTKSLFIGNSPQWSDRCFRGFIDEVRVWKHARTQDEIQSTMNIQLDASIINDGESGLVGYWRLNEGEGQLTADLATNRNLISNGDFSDDIFYWTFQLDNGATAAPSVNDGHYSINIENGGQRYSDLALSQNNIYLEQNKTYKLKFDAWADSDKIIEVKLWKITEPFIDYGRIGAVFVQKNRKQYTYSFDMTAFTDNSAVIEFLVGGNNANIYFDNISLISVEPTHIRDQEVVPEEFVLFDNFPNPFNPVTTMRYSIPYEAHVQLQVYNVRGQLASTLVDQKQDTGIHNVLFDAGHLSSGTYFYKLTATADNANKKYIDVKKLVLLK